MSCAIAKYAIASGCHLGQSRACAAAVRLNILPAGSFLTASDVLSVTRLDGIGVSIKGWNGLFDNLATRHLRERPTAAFPTFAQGFYGELPLLPLKSCHPARSF